MCFFKLETKLVDWPKDKMMPNGDNAIRFHFKDKHKTNHILDNTLSEQALLMFLIKRYKNIFDISICYKYISKKIRSGICQWRKY